MANPVDAARNRVSKAQDQLNEALADGAPTADLRERLDRAQSELQRIESAAAPKPDQSRAAEIEAAATALVDEARAELGTAAELPAGIARALATARREAADHAAEVQAHNARVDALRARLKDLEADRGQIITRRAEGRQEGDDASRLTLLDADREGLAALIDQARSQAPGECTARVADWQAQWDKAVNDAHITHLIAQCDRLAADLAESLRALRHAQRTPTVLWHKWADLDRIRQGLVS